MFKTRRTAAISACAFVPDPVKRFVQKRKSLLTRIKLGGLAAKHMQFLRAKLLALNPRPVISIRDAEYVA